MTSHTDVDERLAPAAEPVVRRARRNGVDPVLGGVASGLASHLGLAPFTVRVVFVLSSGFGGLGVAYYAALWLLLPVEREPEEAPGLAAARRGGRRPGRRRRLGDLGPVVALVALGIGLLLVVEALTGRGAALWPVLLGVAGTSLLWRQADEAQRERWLDGTGRLDPRRLVVGDGGWAAYARLSAGVALVVLAAVVLALRGGSLAVARDVLLAGGLAVLGLGIVVGPWVVRLVSDLAEERAERVRSQDRADVAAHLHDSVLQTLALIQRNAADPGAVARLARAQERELRTWLFEGDSVGASTLAGALREAAAAIEDAHGIAVDVVCVGDHELDDQLRAVAAAAREALANAARHGGVGQVSVFAEVSDGAVEVFVRDRGRGFDLDAVPADRLGVRGSIIDRLERHGGSARVRTAPGEGTEVRLSIGREHRRSPSEEEKR